MRTEKASKPLYVKQGDTALVSIGVFDGDTQEPYDFSGVTATSDVRDASNISATPVLSLGSELGTISLSLGSVTFGIAASTIAVGHYLQDFKVTSDGVTHTWFERDIYIQP